MKDYPFIIAQLEKVAVDLQEFYFSNQVSDSKKMKDNETSNTPLLKLTWTGGVATLATLFHELRTEVFENQTQPFLKASPKQIENLLLNHFIDEKGEGFSQASLATYLDPSKSEKKAKRNKVPLEDKMFKPKK